MFNGHFLGGVANGLNMANEIALQRERNEILKAEEERRKRDAEFEMAEKRREREDAAKVAAIYGEVLDALYGGESFGPAAGATDANVVDANGMPLTGENTAIPGFIEGIDTSRLTPEMASRSNGLAQANMGMTGQPLRVTDGYRDYDAQVGIDPKQAEALAKAGLRATGPSGLQTADNYSQFLPKMQRGGLGPILADAGAGRTASNAGGGLGAIISKIKNSGFPAKAQMSLFSMIQDELDRKQRAADRQEDRDYRRETREESRKDRAESRANREADNAYKSKYLEYQNAVLKHNQEVFEAKKAGKTKDADDLIAQKRQYDIAEKAVHLQFGGKELFEQELALKIPEAVAAANELLGILGQEPLKEDAGTSGAGEVRGGINGADGSKLKAPAGVKDGTYTDKNGKTVTVKDGIIY